MQSAQEQPFMIKLTRLSRVPVVLNSDLIEHIDETPDTVITLTSGQKIVVLESAEDIVRKVMEFRTALASRLGCGLVHTAPRIGLEQETLSDGRK
jgi:flagellar protein FlbD